MMLFSILSDEIARKQRRRSDFVSRRRDQKTTRTWELREKRLKLLLAPSLSIFTALSKTILADRISS